MNTEMYERLNLLYSEQRSDELRTEAEAYLVAPKTGKAEKQFAAYMIVQSYVLDSDWEGVHSAAVRFSKEHTEGTYAAPITAMIQTAQTILSAELISEIRTVYAENGAADALSRISKALESGFLNSDQTVQVENLRKEYTEQATAEEQVKEEEPQPVEPEQLQEKEESTAIPGFDTDEQAWILSRCYPPFTSVNPPPPEGPPHPDDMVNLKKVVLPALSLFYQPLPTDPFPVRQGMYKVEPELECFTMLSPDRMAGFSSGKILILENGKKTQEYPFPCSDVYSLHTYRHYLIIRCRRTDGQTALACLDTETGDCDMDYIVAGSSLGQAAVDIRGEELLLTYSCYRNNLVAVAFEYRSDIRTTVWKTVERVSALGSPPAVKIGERTAALGLPDGRLFLADKTTGEPLHAFPGFGMQVHGLHYRCRDEILIAGDHMETRVYSLLSYRLLYCEQNLIRDISYADAGDRTVLFTSAGPFLADLSTGRNFRAVSFKNEQVSILDENIFVLEEGVLHSIRDMQIHEMSGPETGRYYHPGDELWVFSEGDFRVSCGKFSMLCRESLIMDAVAQRNTSFLRPESGEIMVYADHPFRIIGGQSEQVPGLTRTHPEEQEVHLYEREGVCWNKPKLDEFRYNFSDARIERRVDSGSAEDCLNIVLFGDGFIEEDLEAGGPFETYADQAINAVQTTFPFSLFKDRINFFLVYMASRERGADDDPETDNVNTAFNAAYTGIPDIPRALIVQNKTAIVDILQRIPHFDLAGTLVNDTRLGGTGEIGSGGFMFTSSIGSEIDIGSIVVHELGHTFGGLADEYEDNVIADQRKSRMESPELPWVNVQKAATLNLEDMANTLKWKKLYNDPRTGPHTGAFEGGWYTPTGVYRPAASCCMRDADRTFCPVCAYEIYKALCLRTGREEDWETFTAHFT